MSSVAVNERVAALLQEYAELLSLTGGEAFKVRVYEKAARSVGGYPTDVSTVDDEGSAADPERGSVHRGENRRVPADRQRRRAGGAAG